MPTFHQTMSDLGNFFPKSYSPSGLGLFRLTSILMTYTIHTRGVVVASGWTQMVNDKIKDTQKRRTLGFFHKLIRFLFDVSRDNTINPQNNVDIVVQRLL